MRIRTPIISILCKTLLLLLGALISAQASAASSYTPETIDPISEPWRWHHVKQLDNFGVRGITQDKSGSVWFGSKHGVLRYDGLQWHRVDEDFGLSDLRVRALFAASNDIIYARSRTAIHRYQNERWETIHKTLNKRRYSEFLESADGSIWSLEDFGIIQIKPAQPPLPLLTKTKFDDIFIDGRQNLWTIESQTGTVARYAIRNGELQQKPEQSISLPKSLKAPLSVFSLALHEDCLWLGSSRFPRNLHCYQLQSTSWRKVDLTTMGGSNGVNGMSVDRNGALWVWGSYSISIYQDKQWQIYSTPKYDIPTNDYILAHTIDGSVWFGGEFTTTRHIDLSDKRWGHSYKGIHYYFTSKSGIRWFLDIDSNVIAHHKNADRWIAYTPLETGIDKPTLLTSSSDGTVWLAGGNKRIAAIARFDGSQWQRDLHPSVSTTIGYQTGLETSGGRILFGASTLDSTSAQPRHGGIIAYRSSGDDYQFELIPPPKVPKFVVSLAQRKDRSLWIAYGINLATIQDDQLQNIVNEKSLAAHPELKSLGQGKNLHIVRSADDNIWIANSKTGIYRFNGQDWQRFTTIDGLHSDVTSNLLPVNDGSLLAVTNLGINRFDGTLWSDFLNEVTSVRSNVSSLRHAEDGDIWINFSATDWFTAARKMRALMRHTFITQQYRPGNKPPDTHIEVYSNEIRHNGLNHISWSGIDAGLHKDSTYLQYSYQLDNQPWSVYSNAKQHVFGGLTPGQHRVKVRARDVDFNIDPTPAEISFYVVPPLWQQTWFQLSLLAIIAAIGFFILLIVRLRERHIREIESIKINFFTNISHELRTPLTLILGPVEKLLAEKRYDENSLSLVQGSAKRLLSLVNQLLDFRKLQNDNLELQTTELDIVDHVKAIINSLQPLAEQKRIRYQCTLPTDPYPAWFDADKLEKILDNLIGNAIKYTQEEGKVSISLRLIDITDDEKPRSTAQIVVEDNGIGIQKDHIEHIFDPFYRVKGGSTHVSGTGIGLSLTKQLVDICGGEIYVSSPVYTDPESPDIKGSRFTVTLPIDIQPTHKHISSDQKPDEVSKELVTPIPPSLTQQITDQVKPCVLIVEDDIALQAFIADGIRDSYNVITASNGEHGWAQIQETLPDLIVTDLMMPVLNGLDFCQRVKTDENTSHIPVIMLTARNSKEAELQGLENGADDYVTKPFSMPILKARLYNILAARQKLRERFSKKPVLPAEVTTNKADEQFLQRAMNVVKEHISDHNYSIEEFTQDMNMKYTTLYRKIRVLTNLSLQAFIRNIRLERSMELLKNSDSSIADIAHRVGFEDANYFSRCFKKQFGVSPSDINRAGHTA